MSRQFTLPDIPTTEAFLSYYEVDRLRQGTDWDQSEYRRRMVVSLADVSPGMVVRRVIEPIEPTGHYDTACVASVIVDVASAGEVLPSEIDGLLLRPSDGKIWHASRSSTTVVTSDSILDIPLWPPDDYVKPVIKVRSAELLGIQDTSMPLGFDQDEMADRYGVDGFSEQFSLGYGHNYFSSHLIAAARDF